MVTYTVHERENEAGDVAQRADKIVFVKEGYAWAGLLIPIVWLLYHRMWLVLAGFVAIMAALHAGLAAAELADDVAAWTTFGVSGLFALLANDLRRWTLRARGFRLVEPVSGRDRAECEERFFTGWLAVQESGQPLAQAPASASPLAVERAGAPSAEADDVIGLFPEPGK
jgi:hypothetical protein